MPLPYTNGYPFHELTSCVKTNKGQKSVNHGSKMEVVDKDTMTQRFYCTSAKAAGKGLIADAGHVSVSLGIFYFSV